MDQRDNPPEPPPAASAVPFAELEAIDDDEPAIGPVAPAARGGIRDGFRRAADDRADLIVNSLEEALRASKPHKVKCSCGKDVVVTFPDATARTNAADKLVALGYGKPSTDDSAKSEAIDFDIDITRMEPDERAALRRRILARFADSAARLEVQRAATEAERRTGTPDVPLPVRRKPR